MQSIQYHRYGGPEEMRLEEVEIPKPGREEALALGMREAADYRAFDIAAYQHRFDLVFDQKNGQRI